MRPRVCLGAAVVYCADVFGQGLLRPYVGHLEPYVKVSDACLIKMYRKKGAEAVVGKAVCPVHRAVDPVSCGSDLPLALKLVAVGGARVPHSDFCDV